MTDTDKEDAQDSPKAGAEHPGGVRGEDAGGPRSTTDEVKRGLWWMGSATAVMRVLDLGATLVVMALLTREEMGIAVLSWSVAVVLEAFTGLGVGVSLVQAPEVSDDEWHASFWFSTGLGAVLFAAVAAGSPLIAAFYDEPLLAPLVIVSAAKLVFVGAALVPQQSLMRALDFGAVGRVRMIATFLNALLRIGLAVAGLGAWALVIPQAASGLLLCIGCFVASRYRPRLAWKPRLLRRHLSFGLRASGSSVVYHVYRNADYFLVGKFLGAEVLGVYRVAYDVSMIPTEAIMEVVNRVAFPVFSRIAAEREKLAAAFVRMTRAVTLLAAPVAAILYFTSGDLLTVITSDRWLPAAPVITVLCWAALIRGWVQLFPQLFHACGRPGLALAESLLNLAVTSTCLVLALTVFRAYGLVMVGWAWIASYAMVLPFVLYFGQRLAGLSLGRWLRAVVPPLAGIAVMSLACAGVWIVVHEVEAPVVRLLVLLSTGLVAYLAWTRLALGIRPRDMLPSRP